jgi:hypothetical protein
MSPVVLITAGRAVRYSTNNGIVMSEYDDGELYQVPQWIADGMVKRGWAKLATAETLAAKAKSEDDKDKKRGKS